MNCIFVTQGGYVRSFYLLEQALKRISNIRNTGYYVSDKEHFFHFKKVVSHSWITATNIVSEWEIMESAAQNGQADYSIVEKMERKIGNPTFWNALLCDRRIFYGKDTVFTQDYSLRFTHEEMLKVLAAGIKKIIDHIDTVQPDFIVSFINVTFGEYIYYLIAKERKIPFLNIRNTKIDNFINIASNIFEPSNEIKHLYNKKDDLLKFEKQAASIFSNFKAARVSYEGQDFVEKNISLPSYLSIAGVIRVAFNAGYGIYKSAMSNKTDNHRPNVFRASLYKEVINPYRYRRMVKHNFKRFKSIDELKKVHYAFFPLHLEPEISLLIYSRPYLNQIEVIRWFALSLPVGWKLVIKDHPKNPFYRKQGYFKKLFEIPNLLMVAPDTSTYELIHHSQAVLTISGFIGFEAVCQAKPVLAIGRTSFEFLPTSMYRRVKDPQKIAEELYDLMHNFKHDESALKLFIKSVIRSSIRFDWYTIGKSLRTGKYKNIDKYSDKKGLTEKFDRLASYVYRYINNLNSE